MPTSIPSSGRRSVLREAGSLLYALHLYGAAGLAAFGWGIGAMLGWRCERYVPMWFCAALFIYNGDRIRPDPADRLNVPLREQASARWRTASLVVLAASAAALLAWPIVLRDWTTLALTVSGALVSVNYSWPLLGFRFKDVPLLKSFFAPTIVTVAVIALPRLHTRGGAGEPWLATAWCWCFLEFNMLLCDLRDIDGDRRTGIRSLPVVLGERRTRRVLTGLLVAAEALALAGLTRAPVEHAPAWLLLCIIAPVYLAGLLLAVRKPRSEGFYEWCVEGMLFLPALAVLAGSPH